MERITVGETILPSGRPVARLSLLSPVPPQQSAFKLLVADDGVTMYARQYPHLNEARPDEWDEVGPYTGGPDASYRMLGFDKQNLTEFLKDA